MKLSTKHLEESMLSSMSIRIINVFPDIYLGQPMYIIIRGPMQMRVNKSILSVWFMQKWILNSILNLAVVYRDCVVW